MFRKSFWIKAEITNLANKQLFNYSEIFVDYKYCKMFWIIPGILTNFPQS